MADFEKTLKLKIEGAIDPSLAASLKKAGGDPGSSASSGTKTLSPAKGLHAEIKAALAAMDALDKKMTHAATMAGRLSAYMEKVKLAASKGLPGGTATVGGMLSSALSIPKVAAVKDLGGALSGLGGMLGGGGGGSAVLGGMMSGVGGLLTKFAGPIGWAMAIGGAVKQVANQIIYGLMTAGYLFLRLSRTIHGYWVQIFELVKNIGMEFAKSTVSLVKEAATLESLQSRLGVVFGAQAGAQLQDIIKWAQKVPYTIDDMIDAFIRLKAGGVADAVGNIGRAFKAASDLAVTFGVDVLTASKALQGVYAGRMDIMTRRFGIRAPQLVPFGAVLRSGTGGLESKPGAREQNLMAAIRFVEARFGGATERMANNLQQLMTNVIDMWLRFALILKQQGITDVVGGVIKAMQELFDRLESNGVLQQWAQVITAAYQRLQPLAIDLLERLPFILNKAVYTFYGIFDKVVALYTKIGGADAIYNVVSGILDGAGKIADALQDIVPKLLEALPQILHVFAGLTRIVTTVWAGILRGLAAATYGPGDSAAKKWGIRGAIAATWAINPAVTATYAAVQKSRTYSGLTTDQLTGAARGVEGLGGTAAQAAHNIARMTESWSKGGGGGGNNRYMNLEGWFGWRKPDGSTVMVRAGSPEAQALLGDEGEGGAATGYGRGPAALGGVFGAAPMQDMDYYGKMEDAVGAGTYSALEKAGLVVEGGAVARGGNWTGPTPGVVNVGAAQDLVYWNGKWVSQAAMGAERRNAALEAGRRSNEAMVRQGYSTYSPEGLAGLQAWGYLDTAMQNRLRGTTGRQMIAAMKSGRPLPGDPLAVAGPLGQAALPLLWEQAFTQPYVPNSARSRGRATIDAMRAGGDAATINNIYVDARGASDPAAVEAGARRGTTAALRAAGH